MALSLKTLDLPFCPVPSRLRRNPECKPQLHRPSTAGTRMHVLPVSSPQWPRRVLAWHRVIGVAQLRWEWRSRTSSMLMVHTLAADEGSVHRGHLVTHSGAGAAGRHQHGPHRPPGGGHTLLPHTCSSLPSAGKLWLVVQGLACPVIQALACPVIRALACPVIQGLSLENLTGQNPCQALFVTQHSRTLAQPASGCREPSLTSVSLF